MGNECAYCFALLLCIPLIGQVRHIIISKMSGSSDNAPSANRVIIESDGNIYVRADVNIVRLTVCNTSIVVRRTHRKDICMILIGQGCLECIVEEDEVVCLSIDNIVSVDESLVIETPFISIICILSCSVERVVQHSDKANIVAVANPRISSYFDCRVRKNYQLDGSRD